jgi:hypothetical protein
MTSTREERRRRRPLVAAFVNIGLERFTRGWPTGHISPKRK